jgi:hypothetical protein
MFIVKNYCCDAKTCTDINYAILISSGFGGVVHMLVVFSVLAAFNML